MVRKRNVFYLPKMNIIELIECIHKHKTLWDQKDLHYSNRVIVREKWDEVAREMNLPAHVCRTRWRSLRDIYRKEMKKFQTRVQQNYVSPQPKWMYFQHMHFIANQIKEIGPLPVLETRPKNEAEYSSGNMYLKEETIFKEESDDGEDFQDGEALMFIEQDDDDDAIGVEEKIENNKRKFSSGDDDDIAKRIKLEEENSDYYFLVSLLPYLKNVPEDRKILVRHKMQSIFIDEQNLS